MTHSQNPPTIEEMKEILFVIRLLSNRSLPGSLSPKVLQAIEQAKYCLMDAIERPAA